MLIASTIAVHCIRPENIVLKFKKNPKKTERGCEKKIAFTLFKHTQKREERL